MTKEKVAADIRQTGVEMQNLLQSTPPLPTPTRKPVPRKEATLLSQHVSQIACDQLGNMWFVTGAIDVDRPMPDWSSSLPTKGQLAKQEATGYEIIYEGEGLGVEDLLFDRHNILWILSSNKLIRYDGNGHFDVVYALPDSSGLFQTFALDQNNTIWAGGLQTGLIRFDGSSGIRYTTSNSTLPTNSMTNIIVDHNNIVWVALWDHQGVLKIEGKDWNYYNSQNSGITRQNIWALAVDHQANLWIGTGADDPAVPLMRFNGTDWVTIPPQDSRGNLFQGTIRYLATDQSGKIWASCSNAVFVFDGEHWQQNTVVPNDYVSDIVVDKHNNVWISTLNKGTYKIEQ